MERVKVKTVKHNFIMNSIVTMLSFLFPLISFPYVSRVLLPSGTGRVSFALMIISYFSMFAQFGVQTYGVRECAKVRDDKKRLSKTVQELVVVNIIMSIVAYIIYFSMIAMIPKLHQEKVLFYILGISILLDVVGVEWLYRALEKYDYIAVRSIVVKTISLIAMFLLIHKESDYILYGGLAIFANSASNVLNFINVRRYINVRPVKKLEIKKHFCMMKVFFFMSIAITIYTNLDLVMLGFMKSDMDVGYYNAGVKVRNILVAMVTAITTVLLPRVSYYLENGQQEKVQVLTNKALNVVCLIAAPIVVFFMLFAKNGILLLAGAEYGASIVPMQIIMPTVFLIGISNLTGMQILIPRGKENTVLISVLVGALVDILMNFYLIPKYEAAGAALGTLIAECAVLVIQCCALKKMKITIWNNINLKIILIGCSIGVIFSAWVKKMEFSDLLTLLLGGIIFFGCYGLVYIVVERKNIYEILINLKKIIKERNL